MKLTGRVVYRDIETGVWVLEGDDGRTYQLAGGDRKIKKDGQRIEADGRRGRRRRHHRHGGPDLPGEDLPLRVVARASSRCFQKPPLTCVQVAGASLSRAHGAAPPPSCRLSDLTFVPAFHAPPPSQRLRVKSEKGVPMLRARRR